MTIPRSDRDRWFEWALNLAEGGSFLQSGIAPAGSEAVQHRYLRMLGVSQEGADDPTSAEAVAAVDAGVEVMRQARHGAGHFIASSQSARMRARFHQWDYSRAEWHDQPVAVSRTGQIRLEWIDDKVARLVTVPFTGAVWNKLDKNVEGARLRFTSEGIDFVRRDNNGTDAKQVNAIQAN